MCNQITRKDLWDKFEVSREKVDVTWQVMPTSMSLTENRFLESFTHHVCGLPSHSLY